MFYNELLFVNISTPHVRFASNFAFLKVAELLEAKGMNPEIAITRAQEVFAVESEKASLYLHNLQSSFDAKVMKKVYDFLAHKALLQEVFSFSSYDQVLGMIQQSYRFNLNEQELRQIRRVCEANRYNIALVR